ncbi:MAG: hypothetical protein CMB80_02600 [Flammeovirgaceae bacterium]|nr:hypothetical protein [Flammeovirgaceae bacterium]|tara:strand:- start:407 stop:790 length:384 start_codon:yes stop_codon:yes gene_type:complete
MNQNINNMIDSLLNNNKDDFSAAFVSEIQDRITTNIVDKNVKISQNLLNDVQSTDEDQPIDEAKTKSTTYTFINSSDVKKFIKAASQAGVGKKNFNIKGKTVTSSTIDLDMEQLLHFLAKDMKAKVT